jgi:hypothetical protein
MNLNGLDLAELTPEQREVLRHILTIDSMAEQDVGIYLLRKIYYEAWGEHGNGRNQ